MLNLGRSCLTQGNKTKQDIAVFWFWAIPQKVKNRENLKVSLSAMKRSVVAQTSAQITGHNVYLPLLQWLLCYSPCCCFTGVNVESKFGRCGDALFRLGHKTCVGMVPAGIGRWYVHFWIPCCLVFIYLITVFDDWKVRQLYFGCAIVKIWFFDEYGVANLRVLGTQVGRV